MYEGPLVYSPLQQEDDNQTEPVWDSCAGLANCTPDQWTMLSYYQLGNSVCWQCLRRTGDLRRFEENPATGEKPFEQKPAKKTQ